MTQETTPWDGLPQNPERDGWHWLQARDDHQTANMREPFPCEWRAFRGMAGGWVRGVYGAQYAARYWRYLGPCPMPGSDA